MGEKRDRNGSWEDRVHLTVKVEGAVLPSYFIALLLSFCVFLSASCLFLWTETRRLEVDLRELGGELKLLQDYTEGRVWDHPYRTPSERASEIRMERTDEP